MCVCVVLFHKYTGGWHAVCDWTSYYIKHFQKCFNSSSFSPRCMWASRKNDDKVSIYDNHFDTRNNLSTIQLEFQFQFLFFIRWKCNEGYSVCVKEYVWNSRIASSWIWLWHKNVWCQTTAFQNSVIISGKILAKPLHLFVSPKSNSIVLHWQTEQNAIEHFSSKKKQHNCPSF